MTRMTDHEHDEIEDHDLGLSHDLPRILGRRRLFRLAGGVGLTAVAGGALVACGSDGDASDAGTGSSGTGSSGAGSSGAAGAPPDGGGNESTVEVADGEIPEETAGPYPGDGSNGVNVLSESGIVRSDLTTSFGDASGVAEGVATTVRLKVYDLSGSDVTPLSGAAIYLWHCDRDGNYSLYSDAVKDENYCRGVQATGDDGTVEFTTIFPACYSGRWPHFHFEVYESLEAATSYTKKLRTSQIALPQETCEVVYATDGYEASVDNLAQVSLDSDMVFSDGHSLQLATVTGSVEEGYVVALNVPV
jgi:protocatechuate 3,4-dioxygenase beta subunit